MELQFRLYIDTDNAAFDDGRRPHEVARILREISVRLDHGESFSMYQTIRDLSGNDVGRAAFKFTHKHITANGDVTTTLAFCVDAECPGSNEEAN